MALPYVLLIGIIVFAVQLLLCRRADRGIFKAIPVICVVLAAVVACVTYVHIFPRQNEEEIFRVFVITLQICYWGLSDGMAWLVNSIVNRIQEKNN